MFLFFVSYLFLLLPGTSFYILSKVKLAKAVTGLEKLALKLDAFVLQKLMTHARKRAEEAVEEKTTEESGDKSVPFY